MSAPGTVNYEAAIRALMGQYSRGVIYEEQTYCHSEVNLWESVSFTGASRVVSLVSRDTIVLEAPACVAAAELVNMVATNTIRLGMMKQGTAPHPVRIYAPGQLTISASKVKFGEVSIEPWPKQGIILCKELTFSGVENDASFIAKIMDWIPVHDMPSIVLNND